MKCKKCKAKDGTTALLVGQFAGVRTMQPDPRPEEPAPPGTARVHIIVRRGFCQLHEKQAGRGFNGFGKREKPPKMTSIVPGPWGELKEARG